MFSFILLLLHCTVNLIICQYKSNIGQITWNILLFWLFFSGCFLRVLENSNTVCIFCDSAAVDLENITVCTYSKDWELSTDFFEVHKKLNLTLYHVFFFDLSVCSLDYTVERKNHTTVTTVIPKIGKISHPVITEKKTLWIQCHATVFFPVNQWTSF